MTGRARGHYRWPLSLLVILVIVPACGRYSNRNATPDEQCFEPVTCSVSEQQAALAEDLATIQNYGETQTGFSTVLFQEEGDRVLLTAYFVEPVDRHRQNLEEKVTHRDRLRVRSAARSRAELQELRARIAERLKGRTGWSLGIGVEKVLVRLAPGDEDFATQLRAEFGDAVTVEFVSLRPIDGQ